jgi:hypothetical protein
MNLLSQDQRSAAVTDLLAILSVREANALDISSAVEILRAIDRYWVKKVEDSPVFSRLKGLEVKDRLQIADQLTADQRGAGLAAKIINEIIKDGGAEEVYGANNLLVLSLIGSGRFREAMLAIASSREQVIVSSIIQDVFNYAMAEWGENRSMPADMLQRVLELEA